MSSLSIRHMNFALREQERMQWARDALAFASLPVAEKADRNHYWWIERKAKRGKGKWIFERDFVGSKKEAAELWRKHYRGGNFRLRHLMKY